MYFAFNAFFVPFKQTLTTIRKKCDFILFNFSKESSIFLLQNNGCLSELQKGKVFFLNGSGFLERLLTLGGSAHRARFGPRPALLGWRRRGGRGALAFERRFVVGGEHLDIGVVVRAVAGRLLLGEERFASLAGRSRLARAQRRSDHLENIIIIGIGTNGGSVQN